MFAHPKREAMEDHKCQPLPDINFFSVAGEIISPRMNQLGDGEDRELISGRLHDIPVTP